MNTNSSPSNNGLLQSPTEGSSDLNLQQGCQMAAAITCYLEHKKTGKHCLPLSTSPCVLHHCELALAIEKP